MSSPSRAEDATDTALAVGESAARGAAAPVKSAGRALQELELFDELQREARVCEIARRLAAPQYSTSVLLKSLTQLGDLVYDPDSRSYLPSPRVALLGTWLDKGPVRDGSLVRMLEDLSARTGGTVILAARSGIVAEYVHVLQARTAMRFHVPPGTRRLVVWSATGTALLSEEPASEIGALVRRTNVEAARDQPPVPVAAVLSNVAQLRRDGHFFSRGLVTLGAGSIAVPLPHGVDRRDRPPCRRGLGTAGRSGEAGGRVRRDPGCDDAVPRAGRAIARSDARSPIRREKALRRRSRRRRRRLATPDGGV